MNRLKKINNFDGKQEHKSELRKHAGKGSFGAHAPLKTSTPKSTLRHLLHVAHTIKLISSKISFKSSKLITIYMLEIIFEEDFYNK